MCYLYLVLYHSQIPLFTSYQVRSGYGSVQTELFPSRQTSSRIFVTLQYRDKDPILKRKVIGLFIVHMHVE